MVLVVRRRREIAARRHRARLHHFIKYLKGTNTFKTLTPEARRVEKHSLTVASLAVGPHHLLGPPPHPQQVNGRDPAPPSSRPALPRWPAASSSADAWARSGAAVCWGRPRLAGAGRTRGCAAAGRRRVDAGVVPRCAAVAQPVEVAAPVAAAMQAREAESARQWRLDGDFFSFFFFGLASMAGWGASRRRVAAIQRKEAGSNGWWWITVDEQ